MLCQLMHNSGTTGLIRNKFRIGSVWVYFMKTGWGGLEVLRKAICPSVLVPARSAIPQVSHCL
jgi:phosphosulfolactate synthase (CoM biosynthesis protein A)